MTISIQDWESNMAERENRLIEIENKLYQQQKLLEKLMRQMFVVQSGKRKQNPTIKQVLERFTTKIGKDSEETQRKYNVIYRYINALGIQVQDKYSKLHNEQALLQIVNMQVSLLMFLKKKVGLYDLCRRVQPQCYFLKKSLTRVRSITCQQEPWHAQSERPKSRVHNT